MVFSLKLGSQGVTGGTHTSVQTELMLQTCLRHAYKRHHLCFDHLKKQSGRREAPRGRRSRTWIGRGPGPGTGGGEGAEAE